MRKVWILSLVTVLAGCNWIGNVSGLNRDANRATGAACRQTGRSLEACYLRNPDADRAQIYAGWKEMSEYMAKNNLPLMAPPPDPILPKKVSQIEKKKGDDDKNSDGPSTANSDDSNVLKVIKSTAPKGDEKQ